MGKVTVYIWLSSFGGRFVTASAAARSGGFVGHVSALISDQNGDDYISFWPKNGSKSTGIFSIYDLDRKSEKSEPHAVIEFEYLDIQAIRKNILFKGYEKLSPLSDTPYTWAPVLNLDQPANKAEHNCCTVIWNLLKAGGISKYNPRLAGPKTKEFKALYRTEEGALPAGKAFGPMFFRKWVVTPKLILHLVSSAKENEQLAGAFKSKKPMSKL